MTPNEIGVGKLPFAVLVGTVVLVCQDQLHVDLSRRQADRKRRRRERADGVVPPSGIAGSQAVRRKRAQLVAIGKRALRLPGPDFRHGVVNAVAVRDHVVVAALKRHPYRARRASSTASDRCADSWICRDASDR